MKHLQSILGIASMVLCLSALGGFAQTEGIVGEVPALSITVEAQEDTAAHTPMTVTVDEHIYLSQPLYLEGPDGMELPCMALPADEEGATQLAFILPAMSAGDSATFALKAGRVDSDNGLSVNRENNTLIVEIGGEEFTTYDFSLTPQQPRPIFYPLFGPEGERMTRGYPMQPFEGEADDHPHHQSLWVSHGDVNGVNFWHLDDDEQAYQRHLGFDSIYIGPVCARFTQQLRWEDHEGNGVIHETRTITIWGTPDESRMIDFDMTFTPAEGDVTWGDTKEGGLVSLRVAHTMRERRPDGEPGGVITTADGNTTEGDAWGTNAPWCDYSGPVGDSTAGLSILCHPDNPLKSHYHVRGYGLFTANPFGLSFFLGDDHDGTQVLEIGDAWNFNYRVYVHAGDVEGGSVDEAYAGYADGLSAEVQ